MSSWAAGERASIRGFRADIVNSPVDAVELGLGDDFHDEFRSLATVLAWVKLSCIVSIDVSVHANPVVLRDEYRCS